MFKIVSVIEHGCSISADKLEGIAKLLIELNSVRLGPREEAYEFLRDHGRMSAVDGFQGVLWLIGDEKRVPIDIRGNHEIFSSILIYMLLKDSDINPEIISVLRDVISRAPENGAFYFFDSKKSREIFPENVDCTALGAAMLLDILKSRTDSDQRPSIDLDLLKSIAEKIVSNILTEEVSFSENVLAKDVIRVYFSHQEARKTCLDPVVCANALYFLSEFQNYCFEHLSDSQSNYLDKAKSTEDFLYDVLEKKAYLDGTGYYSSPMKFLFFLTNMASSSERLKNRFYPTLKQAINDLMGSATSPLDLAMKSICARRLGIQSDAEKIRLTAMQEQDGGWPIDTFWADRWVGVEFGSRALNTAFALNALDFFSVS